MMVKMPTAIQVGPYRYRVLVDKTEMDASRVQFEDINRIAECRRWRLEILLTPEIAPDLMCELLLHEILHAVWSAVRAPSKNTTEEIVVSHLAPTLLDTLRRNPDLVAYLIDGGE